MNIADKIAILDLKINFYKDRLLESQNAVTFLATLNNQEKIDMNQKDILNYSNIIKAFENERSLLTIQ
jgi:hypothetical protein